MNVYRQPVLFWAACACLLVRYRENRNETFPVDRQWFSDHAINALTGTLKPHSNHYYRATRMHSADCAVARCLSVRLSVCQIGVNMQRFMGTRAPVPHSWLRQCGVQRETCCSPRTFCCSTETRTTTSTSRGRRDRGFTDHRRTS